MGVDPIAWFRRWLRDAERAGVPLFDACALATADRRGRPSARFVLLRGLDERGFVFYTNARSRKGRELRANPRAALVFFWDPIDRQVRVEGRVVEVSAAEADAYWATRPRGSRVAAIVSAQSAPIARREALLRGFREYRGPIARPRHWTGFRVVPRTIEFWRRGAHRLHEREEFRVVRGRWRRRLLQP